MTGAALCSLVSNRGATVYVGRPATLSAADLLRHGGGGDDADEPDTGAECRLTRTTPSYAITMEFGSREAAEKARGSFEDLVGIIDEIFSNEPEPPSGAG